MSQYVKIMWSPIVEGPDKLRSPIFNLVSGIPPNWDVECGNDDNVRGLVASQQIVRSNESLCERWSPEWVWKMAAISGTLPTSQESNQRFKRRNVDDIPLWEAVSLSSRSEGFFMEGPKTLAPVPFCPLRKKWVKQIKILKRFFSK